MTAPLIPHMGEDDQLAQIAAREDLEWAVQRVAKMAAIALVNASRLGRKILNGFGYPDEVFSDAQDARALATVLDALTLTRQQHAELEEQIIHLTQALDAKDRDTTTRDVLNAAGRRQFDRAAEAESREAALRAELEQSQEARQRNLREVLRLRQEIEALKQEQAEKHRQDWYDESRRINMGEPPMSQEKGTTTP